MNNSIGNKRKGKNKKLQEKLMLKNLLLELVMKQNSKLWVLMLLWELVKASITLPVIASGKGTQMQTVSSTGIIPTPSVRDSQVVDTSGDVAWQQEAR